MSNSAAAASAGPPKYGHISQDPAFEKLSPYERIKAVLASDTPHDNDRFFTQFMLRDVKLVSVSHPPGPDPPRTCTVVFSFPVTHFYCNAMNNLHGGAQSFIYDILTSCATLSIGQRGTWLSGGVSRTLNVSYLRPAPVGITVLCEVEVTHAGKTLSLLRGVMKTEKGDLISTCEHHKVAVPFKVPSKI